MDWYLTLAPMGFAACLVIGIALGRWSSRKAREDADLFSFIEQTGYSLQCIVDTDSLDNAWQVTDGIVAIGKPSFEIRDAIRSAASGEKMNG